MKLTRAWRVLLGTAGVLGLLTATPMWIMMRGVGGRAPKWVRGDQSRGLAGRRGDRLNLAGAREPLEAVAAGRAPDSHAAGTCHRRSAPKQEFVKCT